MAAATASSSARTATSRIKLLVDETAPRARRHAHVRFDPATPRLYADGWLVE